jgi:hypothetical protein
MMRLCWDFLFARGALGLEESPVFLKRLGEPSAEEVSAGNKRARMAAHKTSCRRTQMELLNNLMGCFTLIGSTDRPLHFHVKNPGPEDQVFAVE